MGAQTIIFGYVECKRDAVEGIQDAIASFKFDETYPFRNRFSEPRDSYRGAIFAFADGIKAAPEEWGAWLSRFEELLAGMSYVSARVDFDCDDFNDELSLTYVTVGQEVERILVRGTLP